MSECNQGARALPTASCGTLAARTRMDVRQHNACIVDEPYPCWSDLIDLMVR